MQTLFGGPAGKIFFLSAVLDFSPFHCCPNPVALVAFPLRWLIAITPTNSWATKTRQSYPSPGREASRFLKLCLSEILRQTSKHLTILVRTPSAPQGPSGDLLLRTVLILPISWGGPEQPFTKNRQLTNQNVPLFLFFFFFYLQLHWGIITYHAIHLLKPTIQ